MLIKEVMKVTGLTRKAIDYYESKGLVNPIVLENGYRDYSKSNVEILNQVSLLRGLDLSVEEIKKYLYSDKNIPYSIIRSRELEAKLNSKKNGVAERIFKKWILNRIS